MKASELKVIFEIFIEKLDANKEILDANQKIFEATKNLAEEKIKIISAMDAKAERIATYQPKVSYSIPALESFNEEQEKLLAEEEKRITKLFDSFIQNLKSEFKSHKDEKTKLYLMISFLVLLLFNFCFLAYGLNQNAQKKEYKTQAEIYRRSGDRRADYIISKGLKKDYKKWLDNQP